MASRSKSTARRGSTPAKGRKATKPKGAAARKQAPRAAKKAERRPMAGGSMEAGGGAREVDEHIRALGDWRGRTLAQVRALIQQADPDVVEEVKWRKPGNMMAGVPTWSHDGLICTGEPYKDKVKFTFARGAALEDPTGLFNAKDTGATRRAIDVREGEAVDAVAFKTLVQAAVDANAARKVSP